MPLLDSFKVDHTRMHAPAVRVAKTMTTPKGDTITVFDLRFCIPNKEILPEKGIHTLEHLFAGFMRDHLNGNGVEIIDISPMGCRTGFYMSLIGTPRRAKSGRRMARFNAGCFDRSRPKQNPRVERIPMRYLPDALACRSTRNPTKTFARKVAVNKTKS